jgi:transposase, IS5 family
LPKHRLFDSYQKDFLFYERVLGQQRHDKDNIYALHEPAVYCIGKGKDHKQYEYGNKVSIAATAKSNIIVGVPKGHKSPAISITCTTARPCPTSWHTESSWGKPIKAAVCDRGYQGPKTVGSTQIILPAPALKRDNSYQRDKKRKRCQRRAAIEPIIGHLKADHRLSRNFLKGTTGDLINLLMAALAWNLSLWMRAYLAFILGLLQNRINRLLPLVCSYRPTLAAGSFSGAII